MTAPKEGRYGLLRLVLVIAGILFAINVVAVFLSGTQLKIFTSLFVNARQLQSIWPEGPLFDYLLKASCVAYFWIGITFFIACKDPSRYRVLIHLAIVGLLLMGVTCLMVGIKDHIPVQWYLSDSILSFLGAILLIVLRPR